MSVRTFHECDYYEEVDALRDKLEELATQARADALDTESFSEALARRLERGHAPCVAMNTGGAAAHEPPAQLEKDDSNSSLVEGDDVSVGAVEEADDTEGADDELSSSEIDAIFLKNDRIRDEIEIIGRILKRGLSTDDLNHVIRREKELLSELREMRRKLNV